MASGDSGLNRIRNNVANAFSWTSISASMYERLRRFEKIKHFVDATVGPQESFWKGTGIRFIKPYIDKKRPENRLHILDRQQCELHGETFGTFEGRTAVVIVCDFKKIERILYDDVFFQRRIVLCGHRISDNMLFVTEDLDRWNRIMRTFRYPFCDEYGMKMFVPVMANCAENVVGQMKTDAEGLGVVEDGVKTFRAFALESMCRFLFDRNLPEFSNPDSQLFKGAVQLSEGREKIFLSNALYPEFNHGPEFSHFDPTAMDIVKKCIDELVEGLDREGPTDKSLLQRLVNQVRRNCISDHNLYANCIMLIGFSHPAISMTLAAACWEISQSKGIQNRLRTEIDGSLKHKNSYATAIEEMTYLEQVLKETMRKYPSVARIERICNADTDVVDIRVHKGFVCAIPVYALHHDPSLFPKPEVFNPERFSVGGAVITHYSYLPFGEGLRKCLARELAMREMKVFMACLLSQFNLVAPSDTKNLTFNVKKNMLVPEEIPFRIQRRDDGVWGLASGARDPPDEPDSSPWSPEKKANPKQEKTN